MSKFVIEDEFHAEPQGEFESFDEAFSELVTRSRISWDQDPNRCPCTNWKNCGREYQILEYDISAKPYWTLLKSTPVLDISAKGVFWQNGFQPK